MDLATSSCFALGCAVSSVTAASGTAVAASAAGGKETSYYAARVISFA
jgi:hypothetical protein